MIRYASDKFVSNAGSPIKQLYAPKVNADGSIELIEAGIENTDEYIQSFEESTDISVIIARLQAGDTSVLMQRPGAYGDFTKMPKTYAEALQLQIDAHRLYDSLPVDVKNKFNADPNQFFAQSGTKEWFEKIESVLPDEVKAAVFPASIEKEVNVNADT